MSEDFVCEFEFNLSTPLKYSKRSGEIGETNLLIVTAPQVKHWADIEIINTHLKGCYKTIMKDLIGNLDNSKEKPESDKKMTMKALECMAGLDGKQAKDAFIRLITKDNCCYLSQDRYEWLKPDLCNKLYMHDLTKLYYEYLENFIKPSLDIMAD